MTSIQQEHKEACGYCAGNDRFEGEIGLQRHLPELLAPAGGLEQLAYALHYGADAVYMAGARYGLRTRATNFETDDHLKEAVEMAHAAGVKVYITCNAIMHQEDLVGLPGYLEYLNEIGVDAVIANDLATIRLVGKHAPHCAIHASTQCSITNAQAAEIYYEMGAKRVVLARELSLKEIKEIRHQIPHDLELEVFAHGSMCMAYSGRCVISNALTGRDANRGSCTQPCRWKYALVEEKRPGQYIPVEEDVRGSYIMNSKDLNMIRHIPELIDAGVSCLKVEGRVKSAYYVGTVINAYRSVLDGCTPDELEKFSHELTTVSHRPYATGFYFDKGEQAVDSDGYVVTHRWVAKPVVSTKIAPDTHEFDRALNRDDVLNRVMSDPDYSGDIYYTEVSQKNRFFDGGQIEVVKKGQAGVPVRVYGLLEHKGESQVLKVPVSVANVTNTIYSFYTTRPFDTFDLIRAEQVATKEE